MDRIERIIIDGNNSGESTETIKVSFVVPVYNVESYVERCVRSIINQTLSEIEIICINDASTDASFDVLKRLAREDPRIRLYQNRINRGLSFTRNKGLLKAKGEFIWFVDSDDWIIDPSAAETLYRKAKESDIQVLSFDCENIYENEKARETLEEYTRKNAPLSFEEGSGVDMYTSQIRKGSFMCTAWLCFLKRAWLIDSHIRFVDNILHEDLLFSTIVMLSADRVGYLPRRLYGYYRREGSIIGSIDYAGRRSASYAYIIMELYAWMRNKSYNQDTVDAIACFIRIIKQALVEQYLNSVLGDYQIEYFRRSDQLVVNLAIEESFPFISNRINHSLCDRVKKANSIVVYGAGYVSQITCKFLQGIGIKDYYVAVTKGKTDSIHELSEFRGRRVLLLISVTRGKQQEMIDYARSLGLRDYICMV